jgi:hypothetical protein
MKTFKYVACSAGSKEVVLTDTFSCTKKAIRHVRQYANKDRIEFAPIPITAQQYLQFAAIPVGGDAEALKLLADISHKRASAAGELDCACL